MKEIVIPLGFDAPGSTTVLRAYRFGEAQANAFRVYIQAALHADEIPGLLVADHLRRQLERLEGEGRIRGEITLVPVANPIGAGQFILGQHHGRFELASGENFNRRFVPFAKEVAQSLRSGGTQTPRDVAQLRQAVSLALTSFQAESQLESLRIALMRLSAAADVVLDLHCDGEAVLHMYANEKQVPDAVELCRHLGVECLLHSGEQGGASFEDNLVCQWMQLYEELGVPTDALPLFAVTLELRGKKDVTDECASRDAGNLIDYLMSRKVISADAGLNAQKPMAMPEIRPFAGIEMLRAPTTGVLLYLQEVGTHVKSGDTVAVLVDPVSGVRHELKSTIDGYFFARDSERYVRAGHQVSFIAGHEPLGRVVTLTP